jgi:hypothetical protein
MFPLFLMCLVYIHDFGTLVSTFVLLLILYHARHSRESSKRLSRSSS